MIDTCYTVRVNFKATSSVRHDIISTIQKKYSIAYSMESNVPQYVVVYDIDSYDKAKNIENDISTIIEDTGGYKINDTF